MILRPPSTTRAQNGLDRPSSARSLPLALLLAACSATPPPPPPPLLLPAAPEPVVALPPPPVESAAPPAAPPPPVEPPPPPPAPSDPGDPGAPSDRLAGRYGVDQLRVIGLVFGVAPRALLVDPTGLGIVVKVGDLLGRSEELRPGDPTSSVAWRVQQIRNKDLILVREDPARPGAPPEKRVLPLAAPKRP